MQKQPLDELPKVNLGDEYQAGPITITDVYKIFLNEMKNSTLWTNLQNKVKSYFHDLKKGDDLAVLQAILIILATSYILYQVSSYFFSAPSKPSSKNSTDEKVEKEPLRDFTVAQLREFDGKNGKPIYIALRGEVYDVSSAKEFYGEGCGYNCFAGREASRAMAKLSFEEEDLASSNISDLGPFEKNTLDDWVEKFKYYRNYPVMGKVSNPPFVGTDKVFSSEELSAYNGLQEVPAGRVDAPIYVGINGKVLDVSYGGKEMYSKGGPYFIFAGIDASRALAKMSFEESDLRSSDLSDLTDAQRKVLGDWETKFVEVRKYPVVGKLF
jgi:membrane-associated progesterone receptor component